jgi:hypothetical protein
MSNSDSIKLLLLEYLIHDVTKMVLEYANIGVLSHVYEGTLVSENAIRQSPIAFRAKEPEVTSGSFSDRAKEPEVTSGSFSEQLPSPIYDFWIKDNILYAICDDKTIKIFELDTFKLIDQKQFSHSYNKIEVSQNTVLMTFTDYYGGLFYRQYNLSGWELMKIVDCGYSEYVYIHLDNLFKINYEDLSKQYYFGSNFERSYIVDAVFKDDVKYMLSNKFICKIKDNKVTNLSTQYNPIMRLFCYDDELYCRDREDSWYYVNFIKGTLDSIHLHRTPKFKRFPEGVFSLHNFKLYKHDFKLV